jgi:mono/diheme cytochrome c family protein
VIARGGPAGAPHAPIGAAAVHARGARRGGADAGADDATRDAATRSIGVAVALGVVTMTFAALLLAYAIVRVQAPAWPPPGEPGLPRVWPWLLSATLAALGASAAMAWARRAVRAQAIATAATETATSPKLTRPLPPPRVVVARRRGRASELGVGVVGGVRADGVPRAARALRRAVDAAGAGARAAAARRPRVDGGGAGVVLAFRDRGVGGDSRGGVRRMSVSAPRSAVAAAAAAVGLVALVLGAGGAACRRSATPVPLDQPMVLGGKTVTPAELRRGAAAFSQYCRPCHGDSGDGAGASGRGLQPPPRDLRLGVYKFAAVAAGQLPTDADFRRIIKGGLHGTAMLAWDIPDVELVDLVSYMKALSPRWLTEQAGEAIVLTVDPWAGRDDAAIERGKRVYHGMAQCAVACHPAYATREEIFAFTQELTSMRVEEFRPDLYAPVPKPSDFGVGILPPDFTFSLLRGGDTTGDIARAIASGIGGTAMPTWKNVLPDLDLWAMAHYVSWLVSLRGTPAADDLHARLLAQPPWTPPPLPDAGTDGPSDAGD